MSSLAPALLDSLQRLLPRQNDQPLPQGLSALISALAEALERGDLGLDLRAEPPAEGVLQALQSCGWLVEAEQLERQPEAVLVRDGPWLRWRRWHEHLQDCITQVLALGSSAIDPAPSASSLRAARQRAEAAGLDGHQCDAVSALLERRLVLLTGGPGTGKTSTVVQMLAAALRRNPELRIALAAPTGKASARLGEAVQAGSRSLEPPLAEQLRHLPSGTLHRLLEAQGDNRFGRNRRHPLELDLLVIDELSMVDLPLMAALLAAMPAQGQLLLVGDPHQLPPVGPGAVLEELCRAERLAVLGKAAVELRTTYRNDGAIAALAEQLRQGSGALERDWLSKLQAPDNVTWLESPRQRLPELLLERLRQQQEQLQHQASQLRWSGDEPDPAQSQALLAQLEALIALSPIRQGAWGVEAIHRALLGELVRRPLQHWPLGTPVLNRQNRPEQGLANGDIGVIVHNGSEPRVLLPSNRVLHPAQLSGAEPAFALTVHKSQGSQYQGVLLLLPPLRHQDPRLIYTGLTRAQREVLLFTPQLETTNLETATLETTTLEAQTPDRT
ncbi:MAG: ATP-dependent DNA helicase [Vulcanococcus sp.]